MTRICGQFKDGYIITYNVPNYLADNVLKWLLGLGPIVKAWIRQDK